MSTGSSRADDSSSRADALLGLYARLGQATWHSQMLENRVRDYAFCYRATGNTPLSAEQARQLELRINRISLRRLLKELREAHLLSSHLFSRLDAMRLERNWMTHELCQDSPGILVEIPDLKALLDRLQRIADESLALQEEVAQSVESYAPAHRVR